MTGPLPGPALVRLRLDLAYDGTDFAGWALQPGLRTVQGELQAALTTILRTPEPVRVTVAGRTDAGVHARGQVVHVDVDPVALAAVPGRSDRAPEAALVSRLAGILPHDVVVHAARPAPAGFDARFGALERRYLYRIADRGVGLDPLRRRDTVWWHKPLDVDAMNEASVALLGLRDFAAFCKRREGATSIRTLLDYAWRRLDDGVLAATVRADAFCHSMVRSLVGAVVPVGEGRREVGWPADLLERQERAAGVHVMPAHGLSLEEVVYPPDDELRARARQTQARRPGLVSPTRLEATDGPAASGITPGDV
ncbi:pseudouridine synthase [Intrasporangium oryzae NRRL B-24470]|uniref:tRNA pseudouridine synthase A n=1 Tax=Intrasporangium oryzae NRRL B-24470 TaxID=1386089 RepID=W9GE31_9MICO|nr:tRNA pseudouridine(38-40) synthase TruA [Intrasporangium oryzae]EWT03063.1 pseudouridine synthase [Intrasporangium oryzae NRRL B-24470]